MFKYLSVFVIGLMLALAGLQVTQTTARSGGADPGHSGSPGESTCRNCHGERQSAAPAGSLTSSAGLYNIGDTIRLTITVPPGSSQNGFQLTVVKTANSNQSPGRFSLVTANNTRLVTQGLRKYVNHSTPSSTGTWQVKWVADSLYGAIRFYAAMRAVGGGIYTASTNTIFQDPTAIKTTLGKNISSLKLGPNPMAADTKIMLGLARDSKVDVSLMSMQGQQMGTKSYGSLSIGDHELSLPATDNLPSGTYLVHVQAGQHLLMRSLVKQ